MEAKLIQAIEEFMSGKDPVTAIIEGERARGFKIVRPGDVPWFRATDWRAASVASINGVKVRLVLLHAFESGRGTLTRTVTEIQKAGMIPTVIDPTRELAATLTRRKWKPEHVGDDFDNRETIWSPR